MPVRQRDGIVARVDTELVAQRIGQPVELGQRAAAVATLQVGTHQHDVGVLVGRVEGDQLGPAPGGAEQLPMDVAEVLAPWLGPAS